MRSQKYRVVKMCKQCIAISYKIDIDIRNVGAFAVVVMVAKFDKRGQGGGGLVGMIGASDASYISILLFQSCVLSKK